jgi:hypothetical protein
MTFALVADVVGNGARQHLLRGDPWKICALGLVLWKSAVFAGARFLGYPSARPLFLWCYLAGLVFLAGAGAWTVVRKKSGIWSATAASAQTALAGFCPDFAVALWSLHRQGSTPIYGHSPYYWMAYTLVVNLLLSVLVGFSGALLARCITVFRKELREA